MIKKATPSKENIPHARFYNGPVSSPYIEVTLIKKRLVIQLKRPLSRGQSKSCHFSPMRNDYLKKFDAEYFFPSSPNDLKLLQYFFDLYRKACGNFLVEIYIFRYRKVILNFALPYDHHRHYRVQNLQQEK